MIYAYIAGVVKTLNKSYENGVTFRNSLKNLKTSRKISKHVEKYQYI